MKISILHWINLALAILLLILGIFTIVSGNIVLGIPHILVAVFNMYVFLAAVACWWHDSDMVLDKFVFTCPKCGAKQIPSFWEWFFVPHISSMRYLKCQNKECGKHVWMRRK